MYSITEQFVSWLASHGYSASTAPPKANGAFVTVERTSGGVVDMVDRPSLAIQTWAPTEPRAEEMGNAIRLLLATGDYPTGVHHVAIDSGPYRFYDEDTTMPRYQLSIDAACQLTD